jgi:hypothetical protein
MAVTLVLDRSELYYTIGRTLDKYMQRPVYLCEELYYMLDQHDRLA